MSKFNISSKIKLAVKEELNNKMVVTVGGFKIGAEEIVVIAGPCSVESRTQIMETARFVKEHGASMLRGGAFKPRTLPYSFQGLGEKGLKLLEEAKRETGLPIVTEVLDSRDIDLIEKYSDILQVGARNMQNYPLLKSLGKAKKPVLLKRAMSSTIEEWLGAAEYILEGGNKSVILCERGIRAFQKITRFTLDLAAIPIIKQISRLPVIVDPSHGTGHASLVPPMSRAAIAAGADGLLIEVHPNPAMALSDGDQSLSFNEFQAMMKSLYRISDSMGRPIA
jgi:3-deoxy-7-phosphoheptulonate synthase